MNRTLVDLYILPFIQLERPHLVSQLVRTLLACAITLGQYSFQFIQKE